jgi:hypothetical protein
MEDQDKKWYAKSVRVVVTDFDGKTQEFGMEVTHPGLLELKYSATRPLESIYEMDGRISHFRQSGPYVMHLTAINTAKEGQDLIP